MCLRLVKCFANQYNTLMQDIIPPPKRPAVPTQTPSAPTTQATAPPALPAEMAARLAEKKKATTTTSGPQNAPSAASKTPETIAVGGKVKPAFLRRFATWAFASLAILLIGSANIASWLNQLVLNKQTFVGTLAPLSDNAVIQDKVASTFTDKILEAAPTEELAVKLLPKVPLDTPQEELKAQLKPVVRTSVDKAVRSPEFAAAWQTAINTGYDATFGNYSSDQKVSVPVAPILDQLLSSLEGTDLSFIAEQQREQILQTQSTTMEIDNSAQLRAVRDNMQLLHTAVPLLVAAAILLGLFAVVISPYRFKTTRKLFLGSAIEFVVTGIVVIVAGKALSGFVPIDYRSLVSEILPQLFNGLIRQSLIAGAACFVIWFILFILHKTVLSRVS